MNGVNPNDPTRPGYPASFLHPNTTPRPVYHDRVTEYMRGSVHPVIAVTYTPPAQPERP